MPIFLEIFHLKCTKPNIFGKWYLKVFDLLFTVLCSLETISHRFQDLKTLSPHSCSVESCLHDNDVNMDNGLTDEEVRNVKVFTD